jgi:hypothetical protein
MKKLVRSIAIVVAIAAPAIASVTPSASAANADAAVIQGAGSISPGLGAAPQAQNINFGGTATVVGTHGVAATFGCSFSGSDLAGSLAEGAGTVGGGCGPINLSLCAFVRVGGAVAVVCAGIGTPKQGAGGVFAFTPDQTPPATVTSYHLVGSALYVDA